MALKWINLLINILLIGLVFTACQSEPSSPSNSSPLLLGYNISDPLQEWALDQDLEEISAIACWNNNAFLAIEDEHGILYHLDKEGYILHELPFAEDGDYEGLTLVENDIWLARSDGHLFQLSNWQYWDSTILEVKEYPTMLKSKNNLEGICYEADRQSLLLACKGSPLLEEGKDNESVRAIFRFNLKEKKLYPNAAFLIELEALENYIEEDNAFLNPKNFAPSDIAIHPQSREIYIPSTKANLILVLQADGSISKIYPLLPQLYEQVEGICFDLDANMYCSSEGNRQAAKIWQISYESIK